MSVESPAGSIPRVRILLADDHPSVLEQIRNLLAEEYDVVGIVCTGTQLLQAARELQPDVIITDVRMPELSGIEASRKIIELGLCKTIVALTTNNSPELARAALNTGILGYVLKENAGEELIQAIKLAMRKQAFISFDIDRDSTWD